ncbi:MAG: Holliday junction resolvase RuvX [Clostridia bacterium]|nr:Holliday junction resolvase RuvX [Clostridia bacterium]
MAKIILGVDYGDARTGLAVNAGTFAFGAGCVRCEGMKKTAEGVAAAAAERKAELIVVGNPINMNGTEGPRSEKCKAFAALLSEMTGIPVELYDERLTTVTAHNILSELNVRGKKRKDNVDELSATLILQDYIDRNLK